jgi:ribosomal protein S18 acetylase RimI-like enzyme
MHSHPNLDDGSLDRIGIWEDAGEIVAVVHYESCLGEVFTQTHPDYVWLKPETLAYAEDALHGIDGTDQRFVQAFVNDFDREFLDCVQARGYQRNPQRDRPMSLFRMPTPFPEIVLPEGFQLKSLQEENDLVKIDRVLWRGFNHPGESPAENLEGRRKMQSVPNFRKDLNIVVQAPDGYFVSYSGTWFEGTNSYAYVEPVATDPDFRRQGLGRAAVLEGIRRCAQLGAEVAFVGSDLAFYLAFGFEVVFTSQCWLKYLDD